VNSTAATRPGVGGLVGGAIGSALVVVTVDHHAALVGYLGEGLESSLDGALFELSDKNCMAITADWTHRPN